MKLQVAAHMELQQLPDMVEADSRQKMNLQWPVTRADM
jgi:hypothetical protein